MWNHVRNGDIVERQTRGGDVEEVSHQTSRSPAASAAPPSSPATSLQIAVVKLFLRWQLWRGIIIGGGAAAEEEEAAEAPPLTTSAPAHASATVAATTEPPGWGQPGGDIKGGGRRALVRHHRGRLSKVRLLGITT